MKKEDNPWSEGVSKVRVATSSCLDICIDDYQAVAWAPVEGKTESFILHPEKDREELVKHIKKAIKEKE